MLQHFLFVASVLMSATATWSHSTA